MTDVENKMRKNLSIRLMLAADARNKHVSQIARGIKMCESTLYKYHYGELPKLFTFFKICEYLDVSADYLLGRTDKMEVNR